MVRRLLDERRIALLTSSSVVGYAHRELRLASGDAIHADRVITIPELRGPRLEGISATLDGFIPIDSHGRVGGLADVYAAGDITDFPVSKAALPRNSPTSRLKRLLPNQARTWYRSRSGPSCALCSSPVGSRSTSAASFLDRRAWRRFHRTHP